MRASYRKGVEWIAKNDEPNELDQDSISSYISTMLLADLFDKSPDAVAKAVLRYRVKQIRTKVHARYEAAGTIKDGKVTWFPRVDLNRPDGAIGNDREDFHYHENLTPEEMGRKLPPHDPDSHETKAIY